MVDPSYPFAAVVDQEIQFAQRMPFMALMKQAELSFPGDPMVGQNLPNTTIKWVDATQLQQFIWLWYMESGTKFPDNFQTIIEINAGPPLPWNYSYSQWGLKVT